MESTHMCRLSRVLLAVQERGAKTGSNHTAVQNVLKSMLPLLHDKDDQNVVSLSNAPSSTSSSPQCATSNTMKMSSITLNSTPSKASSSEMRNTSSLFHSPIRLQRDELHESPESPRWSQPVPNNSPKKLSPRKNIINTSTMTSIAPTAFTCTSAVGLFDASILASKISPHKPPESPGKGFMRNAKYESNPNRLHRFIE